MLKFAITTTCLSLILVSAETSSAVEIKSRDYRYDYGVAQDAGGDMYVLCSKCKDDNLQHAPMPVLAVRFSEADQVKRSATALEYALSDDGGGGVKQSQSNVIADTPSLLGTVHFKFDSYLLSAEEKKKLAAIAKQNNGVFLRLDGYACKIGSDEYNRKLSQRRASEVASYLKKQGILNMSIKGHGEENPVSQTKSLNRRVEIKATKNE